MSPPPEVVSAPEIRFVYFDLGNVLVAFDPAIACARLAELLEVSPAEVDQAVYASGLQRRFERGEVSGAAFAEMLRGQFGCCESDVATAELLCAASEMFTPIDVMHETIRRVRRVGCRVGILSNTCEAHWDWITRQGYPLLREPFHERILSYEVGAMKPDPEIYEAAERAAGVAPEEILFLDDRPENVAAARQRGWRAVTCFGGEEAADAIRAAGLMR